jgi:Fe2+ or Zn2+ uptake regulation protein
MLHDTSQALSRFYGDWTITELVAVLKERGVRTSKKTVYAALLCMEEADLHKAGCKSYWTIGRDDE